MIPTPRQLHEIMINFRDRVLITQGHLGFIEHRLYRGLRQHVDVSLNHVGLMSTHPHRSGVVDTITFIQYQDHALTYSYCLPVEEFLSRRQNEVESKVEQKLQRRTIIEPGPMWNEVDTQVNKIVDQLWAEWEALMLGHETPTPGNPTPRARF